MSMQQRFPVFAGSPRFKRLRGRTSLVAALAVLALVLVPAASSQGGAPYSDASGDSSTAGDVQGVTVANDSTSGQIIFRITGTNLSTSANSLTFLNIDSDANPLTGDLLSWGADYYFGVNDTSYGFFHWNGSDWTYVPLTTLVSGGGSTLMISVNRADIGNPTSINFSVETLDRSNKARDHAPDTGMFNYSLAAGGPDIQSVDLLSTPSAGPRAGKPFTVTPTGLKLPPTGGLDVPKPDSYSCKATLKGRAVTSSGTGGCTFAIPKKRTRGKQLSVTITVNYEGASKPFPYAFTVH